jgi:peptidylprolyl isomerase
VKNLALIVFACLALALAACGDDDSSAQSGDDTSAQSQGSKAADDKPKAADDNKAADGKPKAAEGDPSLQPPPGPPPKEVVIEELEEGSGPAAKKGDTLEVRFVAVNQAGKKVYDVWGKTQPLIYEVGNGEYGPGWDKSLTGLKVGGVRELAIPADQAFEEKEALYYVVELLEIKPPGSGDGGGQGGGANPGQ